MTLQPSSTVPVFNAAAVLEERLIKMVDIERIRYAHFREGSSIRELARAFHHSRTTIRRALDDPGPWTYRRTRRRSGRGCAPTVGPLGADRCTTNAGLPVIVRMECRRRDVSGTRRPALRTRRSRSPRTPTGRRGHMKDRKLDIVRLACEFVGPPVK